MSRVNVQLSGSEWWMKCVNVIMVAYFTERNIFVFDVSMILWNEIYRIFVCIFLNIRITTGMWDQIKE